MTPALLRSWYHAGRYRLHRGAVMAVERAISAGLPYEILVVFGMRRSGNHVALAWMLAQTRGSAAFFNNINPERPPFSARMTEFRLRLRNPSPRLVLSYEDVGAATLLSPPLTGFLADRQRRHGARVRFALILRDPYNLFASRLRKWPERMADPAAVAAARALYAEHAALALAPAPVWGDAPLVPVLYDQLIGDAGARSELAAALGLNDGDRGLDDVPVYGHGSSFQGMAGDAAAMRPMLFSRWREVADHAAMRSVMTDPALVAAGRRLFGIEPPDMDADQR